MNFGKYFFFLRTTFVSTKREKKIVKMKRKFKRWDSKRVQSPYKKKVAHKNHKKWMPSKKVATPQCCWTFSKSASYNMAKKGRHSPLKKSSEEDFDLSKIVEKQEIGALDKYGNSLLNNATHQCDRYICHRCSTEKFDSIEKDKDFKPLYKIVL